MKHTSFYLAFIASLLMFGITSCEKSELRKNRTLNKLYKEYENGEISECTYNGETVYLCDINAYDAGSPLHDKKGKKIASCGWLATDPICGEVMDCEVVYRGDDHITGRPPVDKYDLAK